MINKESNSKHFTRGGQISFHNIRMWFQINKVVLKVNAWLFVFLNFFLTWLLAPFGMISQVFYFYLAKLCDFTGRGFQVFSVPFESGIYKLSASKILAYPYFEKTAGKLFIILLESSTLGLCLSIASITLITRYFVKKGKAQTDNVFVRGASMLDPRALKKQIVKDGKDSDLHIDAFPLIKHSEVQHFLIHGTVGQGKSQLIMKIMDCLRARGDRVIVYDKGCTFVKAYFDASTDALLNPFDRRCAKWDLWLEAPKDELLENMAESLIPMHGENDPFWVNAARTVFSSTASRMREDKDRSIEKLIKLLVTGEFSDLEDYLTGTAAATLVSNKIEKTAISIRSVITTYLKSMQSLSGLSEDKEDLFSIRDYILDESKKGWLFISSNGEQHKSLKPLISMWIAMASLTLLSLPEDAHRRIWFICDELPSLHKLPLLGETIAEVRKFGGCFLLGMQSYSQLVKVYGRSGAQEIFDLLNTRAFFSSPSHEMAQLVSKELGDEEVEDTRENYSYGANSIRDGISLGKNRITKPLITYSEIMNLSPLECFLRLPGNYPITKLQLQLNLRSEICPGFIERHIPPTYTNLNTPLSDKVETETTQTDSHTFAQKKMESSLIEFMD